MIKNLIWLRKIRSVFVHVKKKKSFWRNKNSDLCLLNKTKSFGFFKKNIRSIFENQKNWFLVCIKKNQIRFITKKNKICIYEKSDLFLYA